MSFIRVLEGLGGLLVRSGVQEVHLISQFKFVGVYLSAYDDENCEFHQCAQRVAVQLTWLSYTFW